jgi:aminoglycoside 2'-N-acetyltransferase I
MSLRVFPDTDRQDGARSNLLVNEIFFRLPMTSSPTIKVLKTEELDSNTRNAIIELCVAAHQEEDFRNLFSYVHSGGLHFLACQGKQLVSHAVVTTRWLQPEDRPILKTAYVDAVATLPTHQGQGYGSAVMRHLANVVDRDFVIACLETEQETFYERLGWETWRGALAGRSEQGLIPTPEQTGIMILRLSQTPPLDPDSALTIEHQGGRIW